MTRRVRNLSLVNSKTAALTAVQRWLTARLLARLPSPARRARCSLAGLFVLAKKSATGRHPAPTAIGRTGKGENILRRRSKDLEQEAWRFPEPPLSGREDLPYDASPCLREYRFRPLLNVSEIRAHGHAMHNCLANDSYREEYLQKVLSGDGFLYEVSTKNPRSLHSLFIVYDPAKMMWVIADLRGQENVNPGAAVMRAAHEFMARGNQAPGQLCLFHRTLDDSVSESTP